MISRVTSDQTVTDVSPPSAFTLFYSCSIVEGFVTAFIEVSGSFAISSGLTLIRKNWAHAAEAQTTSNFQCDLFHTAISLPRHKNKCRNT